jgi:hypothetical protein
MNHKKTNREINKVHPAMRKLKGANETDEEYVEIGTD